MNDREKQVIRDLAKKVAEIAARPVMEERRKLWKAHNSLKPPRPMILVFPEGSWREILPPEALVCEDEKARNIEAALRRRIFYDTLILDDTVVENTWEVPRVSHVTQWGLEPKTHDSPDPHGAWGFDPVLNSRADLEQIKVPTVVYDPAEAQKRFDDARELLGDILDVKLVGMKHFSFHFGALYAKRRGLEQMMIDMYTDPELIHESMKVFAKCYEGILKQAAEKNLLDLNNDNTYHNSGGNGWTDELPPKGYKPGHVRLKDMWGSAESQEMAQVSPAMHEEFVWKYEKPLLERFALTGYGCCEDLSRKLGFVTALKNMRRISISPWADVDRSAEGLKGKFIFSWKPNPAHMCGNFDTEALRKYIQHTVDAAKANGCVLEMILKDTHTCENHPERFTEWTRIARDIAEA